MSNSRTVANVKHIDEALPWLSLENNLNMGPMMLKTQGYFQ